MENARPCQSYSRRIHSASRSICGSCICTREVNRWGRPQQVVSLRPAGTLHSPVIGGLCAGQGLLPLAAPDVAQAVPGGQLAEKGPLLHPDTGGEHPEPDGKGRTLIRPGRARPPPRSASSRRSTHRPSQAPAQAPRPPVRPEGARWPPDTPNLQPARGWGRTPAKPIDSPRPAPSSARPEPGWPSTSTPARACGFWPESALKISASPISSTARASASSGEMSGKIRWKSAVLSSRWAASSSRTALRSGPNRIPPTAVSSHCCNLFSCRSTALPPVRLWPAGPGPAPGPARS